MNREILNLLRKYVNGQCSADELEQVGMILNKGLYEDEWDTVLQEDAEKVMADGNTLPLDHERKDKILNQILESTGQKTVQHPLQEENSIRFPAWLRIAASILILLSGGLALMMVSWSAKDDLSQIKTSRGEQTEVSLQDGTLVTLNDQSTLRYPDEFDGNIREVYLQGNAFFEVVSIPTQPFILHSYGAAIEVLGTSFNVQAYEDDRNVTVTLASGRVSVTPENSDTISPVSLSPGDQWVYNKTTGEYRIQKISEEDLLAIKNGFLVFHDQPLGDIARALERRYDLRFRFERQSLQQQQLTYKTAGIDVDEALQVLSLAAGFEYQLINNSEVIVR